VKLNSKGKTWAVIALALIGALIAWLVPGNAGKTQADLPKPAAAKRAAAITAQTPFDFYLMALTVHSAFCADGHSREAECRTTVQRPLVIHGLCREPIRMTARRRRSRSIPRSRSSSRISCRGWLTGSMNTSGVNTEAAAASTMMNISTRRSSSREESMRRSARD
jgi:ribonuclease I